MCKLKLRSRSAPASLDRRARLPLLLALLLGGALLVQIALPDPLELPEAGPLRGVGAAGAGGQVPTESGTVVTQLPPIFSPRFAPVASTGAGSVAMPEPLTIAGSVRVGASSAAIVQGPGLQIRRVRIGGRIGGWQLRSLAGAGALLARGAEHVTVPFGGKVPLAANREGAPR
jgi:hypothetical protein